MISMICVVGKNREIGLNNQLLWHLPNELKFFKNTTINHPIVMGYNTYLSIGRLLPNRDNIVLTTGEVKDGYLTSTISSIKEKYMNNEEEVFIIGGAKTYADFITVADKLYLTEVDATSEADVYFPKFDKENYTREIIGQNEDNGILYSHVLYTRIK